MRNVFIQNPLLMTEGPQVEGGERGTLKSARHVEVEVEALENSPLMKPEHLNVSTLAQGLKEQSLV